MARREGAWKGMPYHSVKRGEHRSCDQRRRGITKLAGVSIMAQNEPWRERKRQPLAGRCQRICCTRGRGGKTRVRLGDIPQKYERRFFDISIRSASNICRSPAL